MQLYFNIPIITVLSEIAQLGYACNLMKVSEHRSGVEIEHCSRIYGNLKFYKVPVLFFSNIWKINLVGIWSG